MSINLVKDLGMRIELNQSRRWCIVECSYCGIHYECRAQALKTTNSCGCVTFFGVKNITHGLSNTRQYKIWVDLKTRCNNPNNKSYIRYGARGITYDPLWEVFENFLG